MLELWLDNQPVAASPGGLLAAALSVSEWQALEFRCIPPPGASLKLTLRGPLHETTLEPFLRPGDPAWRWLWNPQNSVGRFRIVLQACSPDGHVAELHAALDVVPGKIDQQRYERLLNDLHDVAHTLIYALSRSSAGAAFAAQAAHAAQPRHWLVDLCAFYETCLTRLERAFGRIALQPHTTRQPHSERLPLEQARDLSRLRGDSLSRALAGQQPHVVAAISVDSFDSYENRLLKHLLAELWQRVHLVQRLAASGAAEEASKTTEATRTIAARSSALLQRLATLRTAPFLADVGRLRQLQGPSHLMRRDTPYRTIYRLWQELRQHPLFTVESLLFSLPIHELPRLYEYWCVLQVASALLRLPEAAVETQQLCTATAYTAASGPYAPFSYRLTLGENEPVLSLSWRGGHLRLRYQPRYRSLGRHPAASIGSLDSHTHIPDIALEWEAAAQPPVVLVFDAKYRLDASGGLPADALADAYTYLGGIGSPTGQRASHLAAILYPGTGTANHYTSGVSTVPLLPDSVEAFAAWLLGHLQALRP